MLLRDTNSSQQNALQNQIIMGRILQIVCQATLATRLERPRTSPGPWHSEGLLPPTCGAKPPHELGTHLLLIHLAIKSARWDATHCEQQVASCGPMTLEYALLVLTAA